MNLYEVTRALNIKTSIKNFKINSIKTDSRKIEKGDLFIALEGNNYDGHDYAIEAINKGAEAVIVERNIGSNKSIVVKNTYESLFLIGHYIRKKFNIPLIAITGSTGKTTTKELIYHILSSKYKVLKNESSKNNLIGVSSTLFKLDNSFDVIVMELGTNHIGEIEYLSRMCLPDTAIITNIGSSHIGNFRSKKSILNEKLSIKNGMKKDNLIVSGDNKYLKKLKAFKCGMSKKNDLIAFDIIENQDNTSFKIKLKKEYKVIFNNPCVHFIDDILFSIKVALDYGITIKTIIKKVNTFKWLDKRMNIIKYENTIIIDDCYNSSYESLVAGLNALNKYQKDKVVILGDILELGKYNKKIHLKIGSYLNKNYIGEVILIGKNMGMIKSNKYKKYDNTEEFINKCNVDFNNKVIYIKGSRGMHLEKILEYIKNTYYL